MPQQAMRNCFLRIESTKNTRRDTANQPTPNRLTNTLFFTNMPDDIGTTKTANVTPTTILGRSETIKTYGSSGGRAWNLSLQFFAEDTGYANVRAAVTEKLNWCESLVHPQYVNGLSQGLPIVLFKFGDYLAVRTICTSVQTSLPGPWLVSAADDRFAPAIGAQGERLGQITLPLYGVANLVLEDLGDKSWGHDQVKRGAHLGQGRIISGEFD